MKNNLTVIKIPLAILLLLCLLDMPYGFYEFVRFVALIAFGILAYQSKEKENKSELIIYASLALLFQPFFKIALGRTLWNIVDVITAIYLLLNIVRNQKINKTL
ncbi:DUF6804 family protein [Polaribacter sp. 11A2H]|uniref:DUF6804 family protein n=1 Tax=Polaribacter sp. 11A2H TaxID=2687290 RepID=UPI00140BCB27|nr:DUF6804 family protein [Polaribacter sp. 11A2H]